MRVALLSDIHGNRVALEAVLDELADQEVDRTVCLGDLAATGPAPAWCIDAMRKLDVPIVQGNTDEDLCGPSYEPKLAPPEDWLFEINAWCKRQLAPTHAGFLAALEGTATVDLGEAGALLCCHGTPESNVDGLLPETPGTELAEVLAGVEARVVAAGHTHVQMVRDAGDHLVVNPGSVGMPFLRDEQGATLGWARRAEYAVLETQGDEVTVDPCSVPVDQAALEEMVEAGGMPHAERWLGMWEPGDPGHAFK